MRTTPARITTALLSECPSLPASYRHKGESRRLIPRSRVRNESLNKGLRTVRCAIISVGECVNESVAASAVISASCGRSFTTPSDTPPGLCSRMPATFSQSANHRASPPTYYYLVEFARRAQILLASPKPFGCGSAAIGRTGHHARNPLSANILRLARRRVRHPPRGSRRAAHDPWNPNAAGDRRAPRTRDVDGHTLPRPRALWGDRVARRGTTGTARAGCPKKFGNTLDASDGLL
jgi:hypothetical protein